MGDNFPLYPDPPLGPVFVAAMKHGDGRVASPEERREIAQLGVGSDGPDYTFDGFRYEELDDAVAYARIAQSRPTAGEADRGLRVQRARSAGPTVGERELMATQGVQFDGRVYRYAGFSYDRLADAMNQARWMRDRT